jgi:4-diphosphocytidyl-2-C-methyl-D-erythritol kinase
VTTEADAVRVFAPAKINLFLHVGSKRADGYHELESLVVFASVGDELVFKRADELSLSIDGPFADALTRDPDNLVLKAAGALAAHAGVRKGARITLTKSLPVASGIGGGSADAAATLRGLNTLWKLHLAPEALRTIAAQIGSDVPVCVGSKPAWMEGRGERVHDMRRMPEVHMLLVNPGIAISTAQIFGALEKRDRVSPMSFPGVLGNLDGLLGYLQASKNDLEPPARALAPVIDDVLTMLASTGAPFVRMSGSGATCFGIYEDAAQAKAAAAAVSRAQTEWWVQVSQIAPPTIGKVRPSV